MSDTVNTASITLIAQHNGQTNEAAFGLHCIANTKAETIARRIGQVAGTSYQEAIQAGIKHIMGMINPKFTGVITVHLPNAKAVELCKASYELVKDHHRFVIVRNDTNENKAATSEARRFAVTTARDGQSQDERLVEPK